MVQWKLEFQGTTFFGPLEIHYSLPMCQTFIKRLTHDKYERGCTVKHLYSIMHSMRPLNKF